MLYFINKMLCEEPIENVEIGGKIRGYRFKLRLNEYRGCFLSCIMDLKVKMDGEDVPEDSITLRLNDKRYRIHELADQYKEYWYVLDRALVEVDKAGGLSVGEHQVEVTMVRRNASAGYTEDTKYIAFPTTEKKTLVVNH